MSESTGVYANFISDEGTPGVGAAYGDRMAQLTKLKDRMGPDELLPAQRQPTSQRG